MIRAVGKSENLVVPVAIHTRIFDSKFSHIFKTNTKYGLLYERRPRVNIGVKYSGYYF